MPSPADIPVFVLCGGLGTRLREQTDIRPKPMVEVGGRPIVWHIMRAYAHFGFRRFVLCLGYRSEVVKRYFLEYSMLNSDFSVELKGRSDKIEIHSTDHEDDWKVTLADTGERTMTGGRIARAAARYLGDAQTFAVTYGDGVTDVDLRQELEFHRGHGTIGTVLGINPPSRFGELVLDGDRVSSFEEKPDLARSWVNGGYFFFERSFLDYLDADESCILERDPLKRLAADGKLRMFRHPGYWACMDTQRDYEHLNQLWSEGQAPWRR